MKKVLNILIPLFIFLGILDLLIYQSKEEKITLEEETVALYQQRKNSALTVYDEYSVQPTPKKVNLRIEKLCYITPSTIKLVNEDSQIFYPTEIIPYESQSENQYAFLQFKDLDQGRYYISTENHYGLNKYSKFIEIENSMTLSYDKLINLYFSKDNAGLITERQTGFSPLIISIYNPNESCFQKKYIISKASGKTSYEIFFIQILLLSILKHMKSRAAFWET